MSGLMNVLVEYRYVDREGELRPAKMPPGRVESLLPPSAQQLLQEQQQPQQPL